MYLILEAALGHTLFAPHFLSSSVFSHVHSVGDLIQPHVFWIYCSNTDSQISTSSLDALPVLQACALQMPCQQRFLNVKQIPKLNTPKVELILPS